MLARLLLLFVTLPLLELALLVWIGEHVGILPTVALVVGTGVLGATLARYQGLRTLQRFQEALNEGRLPHREILEGILVLLAAAVLLTPGLITDLTGFLLLVPAIRRRVVRWLARRLRQRLGPSAPPGTVDVDFTVDDD